MDYYPSFMAICGGCVLFSYATLALTINEPGIWKEMAGFHLALIGAFAVAGLAFFYIASLVQQ